MNLDFKKHIEPLLFKTGHIDNRYTRVSKKDKALLTELRSDISSKENLTMESIKYSFDINQDKHIISDTVWVNKLNNRVVNIFTTLDDMESIDESFLESKSLETRLKAYMYKKHNSCSSVEAVLIIASTSGDIPLRTVINVDEFGFDNLFTETIEKYFNWTNLVETWAKKRDSSIKKLQFPCKTYRAGQKELAKASYVSIDKGKTFFAQAPTGTGKTLANLFPATKAIGENKIDKIFYLTAKTVGCKVAEESFDRMKDQGLLLRNVTITAKEKICFNECTSCNPVECVYAKNYYGKVNSAIFEILENEASFTRDIIEKYAVKYSICPFELTLDLSNYADAVICDYNYVFDPNVYLRRYFDDNVCSCAFLVDEAHNLVDRARGMYSVEISENLLYTVAKTVRPIDESIANTIDSLIAKIIATKKNSRDTEYTSDVYPNYLTGLIEDINASLLDFMKIRKPTKGVAKILDLITVTNRFLNIVELYDENYMFFIDYRGEFTFKLFCVDPSKNLKKCFKRAKSSIVFSATLSPLDYFRDVLGGDKDSVGMTLQSPFDKKNREVVIVDNISTKYKDRDKSYELVLKHIEAMIYAKTGNYMIFVPSFEYMEKLHKLFVDKNPDIETIKQESFMKDNEREEYMNRFKENPATTLVSFNVISGIFSEGIDLAGERLIGSMIVGTGLPMVCTERNAIKTFFDSKNRAGFDFAYTFPGMNRVVQAAGRVIRKDSDKGIIVLIDDRFKTSKHQSLLPREWSDAKFVKNHQSTKNIIEEFWSK